MSGINFLSDNLVYESDLSFTTGSENAQFPLLNLKNDSPSYKLRTSGNTAVIVFDMVNTRTIDAVAIVGDTQSTFGVTDASFKVSISTDFSGSAPYSLAVSAENNVGYALLGTAETGRFLELTITGIGSYAELSNIFIGQNVNIPNMGLSISSFKYNNMDKSRINTNKYGQKFVDKRSKQKNLGGQIQYMSKDEQEIIDDIAIRHGKSIPVWLLLDPTSAGMNAGNFKLAIYGYFKSELKFTTSGGQHYNTSVDIEEAI